MTETPEVYEPAANESVGETVVRAVADLRGVDQRELDACLYDAVDPTALNRLCGQDSAKESHLQISFDFGGYRVAVDGTGTVFVSAQEPDPVRVSGGSDHQPVLSDPATSWQRAFNRL